MEQHSNRMLQPYCQVARWVMSNIAAAVNDGDNDSDGGDDDDDDSCVCFFQGSQLSCTLIGSIFRHSHERVVSVITDSSQTFLGCLVCLMSDWSWVKGILLYNSLETEKQTVRASTVTVYKLSSSWENHNPVKSESLNVLSCLVGICAKPFTSICTNLQCTCKGFLGEVIWYLPVRLVSSISLFAFSVK